MTSKRITELIYDAIVDETAVDHLAHAIANHMNADTSLMLIGVRQGASPTASCIHGIDEDVVRAYEQTYHAHDPWLAQVGRVPPDVPVSLERWVSRKEFQNSVIYQELVRGRIDIMHCLGLAIPSGETFSTFAFQRGKRGRAFDEGDEKRFAPYAPHLRRLATANIRKATIVAPDLDTLITHPDPVIVTDQHARPVHCSSDGKTLLDAGTVLGRTPTGRVYSHDARFMIEGAIRDAAVNGVSTVRQIEPPCGSHIISVDPCRPLPLHAVITIRNREIHAHRKADVAGARFGLTKAECALVESLLMGMTLEEHCLCRGVVVSTARSQLRSVFSKSEAQRQSELVARVLATPTR